jgi:hypothetical protein
MKDKKVIVQIFMDVELWTKMEKQRGDVPRSAWIRRLIMEATK